MLQKAQPLLKMAGLDQMPADPGLVSIGSAGVQAFIDAAKLHRIWSREAARPFP